MKIESSSIAMQSTHSLKTYSRMEAASITARSDTDVASAILNLSEQAQGGSYLEGLKEYEKELSSGKKESQQESLKKNFEAMLKQQKASGKTIAENYINDKYDMRLKLLERILEAFSRRYGGKKANIETSQGSRTALDLRSPGYTGQYSMSYGQESSLSIEMTGSSGGGGGASVWTRVTAISGSYTESEFTTFQSTGQVKTADGREISFGVSMSMSRAFMSETNILEQEDFLVTDPLVINLDSNVTSISDQKFFFDLDSDGKMDSINFAGRGSGFLALDKNGDGIINDGSELFGTKSGDGFKDLAAYDEDGNGWIDENDSIFKKLKVWTKDEDGKDQLIDLKSADVGAIYLGAADTEYSYKDINNSTNAILRKTGVYLKESTGAVGTMAHVDMAL